MAKSVVSSVFKKGLFNDRVAIVSGGATGIGAAVTQELLYLGASVVICARKKERLDSVAELWNRQFPAKNVPRVTALQCNIRKEDEVKSLVEQTLSKYGRIDFLVNNGGGQFPAPNEKITLKGWNAVLETNLTGTWLMCREAFTQHMKTNGGLIVNIIAEAKRGFPMMSAYMKEHGGCIVNIVLEHQRGKPMQSHSGAARAGVENLTRSLAIEWAENGVRLNAIAPGVIYSETAVANYGSDEIFSAMKRHIPAQRLGTVEEVSSAVCYLLSPAASFITGATLEVDGAQYLYTPPLWKVQPHDKMPAFTWEDDTKSKL